MLLFPAGALVVTQLSNWLDPFKRQVRIKILTVLNRAEIRIVCCRAHVIQSCCLFLFAL
jgi:hypothetical protein